MPFTEQQVATSPKACTLGIGARAVNTVGIVGCYGHHSPDSFASTAVFVFTGKTSPHAANITICSGAEIGTATTLTNATAYTNVFAPWDVVVGTPAAITTAPRTGTYCWELASTTAAESLEWDNRFPGSIGPMGALQNPAVTWSERLHFYFPTALPVGDTDLFSMEVTSLANGCVLRYITASQKLGLKIGTGTEQVSDAVVTFGQWIGVDVYYDPRTTTHTCAWQVDYNATLDDPTAPVAQTTASTASMTAGNVTKVRHGWTQAVTRTVRYDDLVGSRHRKTGLIGDIKIFPLGVDPAGTPTLSGTVGNFRTYTANGTLAAWTAVNTRNVLDEIPFVIGASSDGLTQITAASAEYVEVPMSTMACAPDYSPIAARWYVSGWAATTTAAYVQWQASDGVNQTQRIGSDVDSQFDNSTMVWQTTMHSTDAPSLNNYYQITQAKVDGFAARMGFSNDATPDAGFHGVLVELVVKPADVHNIMQIEDGAFNVYVRQDPLSAAVVSYLITTPPGARGATFTYALAGVDQTPIYVGPDDVHEVSIGAVDITGVTSCGLTPDATE